MKEKKNNIHIINYGSDKFERIQVFSFFRQFIRVQTERLAFLIQKNKYIFLSESRM